MAKVTTKYPEKGFFTTDKAFKDHIKGLSDSELLEWVKDAKLEIKPTDSAPIQRMRAVMAIKELHFPSEKKPAKKESIYKKYTTEELVQRALDNEVLFEPSDNDKIVRMRVIMALRSHGLVESKEA